MISGLPVENNHIDFILTKLYINYFCNYLLNSPFYNILHFGMDQLNSFYIVSPDTDFTGNLDP